MQEYINFILAVLMAILGAMLGVLWRKADNAVQKEDFDKLVLRIDKIAEDAAFTRGWIQQNGFHVVKGEQGERGERGERGEKGD